MQRVMQVIHFTRGATDPLDGFQARKTALVNLANSQGTSQVSCLHLSPGAQILEPPATHDCALLLVHGRMTVTATHTGMRLALDAGVGVTVRAGEHYTLESETGAIVIAVDARHIVPTPAGISTPARIAGQRWPGEEELLFRASSGLASRAPHVR